MPSSVFVGHRFTEEFTDDFRRAVNSAFEEYDSSLRVEYADKHHVKGHILTDNILPLIDDALLCVFDITEGRKPNVFIELGYAYGIGKYFVLTSKGKPPTNLAGFLLVKYSSFENLKLKLLGLLPEIVFKARREKRAKGMTMLSTQAVLDDSKTRLLIELHRASLADTLVPIVERTLMIANKNPKTYKFSSLFRDVNNAIDKSRRLFRGFKSQTLGDMRRFFEKNFTELELKRILKTEIYPIIKSGLPRSAKRNKVYHQIDIEERKVFDRFYEILADKSQKRRNPLSSKLPNKSRKPAAR
ncbi:MAG TPA: hypothetical protein VF528_14555 [Pyrinomonadaceae bacterium]|jgi:hypothetical protein